MLSATSHYLWNAEYSWPTVGVGVPTKLCPTCCDYQWPFVSVKTSRVSVLFDDCEGPASLLWLDRLIWLWGLIHTHPECQFMVWLLFRECSCLLTRIPFFLVLGYLGNLFSWVCVEGQIRTKRVRSVPWVFHSGCDRVWRIEWSCCFWWLCWAGVSGQVAWSSSRISFNILLILFKGANFKSPIDSWFGKRTNIWEYKHYFFPLEETEAWFRLMSSLWCSFTHHLTLSPVGTCHFAIWCHGNLQQDLESVSSRDSSGIGPAISKLWEHYQCI